MKILVAHASKHGSTPEIAAAIARILSSEGADVDLLTARDVTAVDQYDAVIIGSAAYMGRCFAIREGGKTVGSGVVAKILE